MVNVIPALGPAGQAARAPVRGADCRQRVPSTLTFGESGGVGDAEELSFEVRDGFVGAGNHRPRQERGLARDAGHHGIGDVGIGRGDGGLNGLYGIVRGAGRDASPTVGPQRIVDPHQVFPCRHFVRGRLVRGDNRARDCAHFVGVQPTEHLDEDPEFHTFPTARWA